MEIGYSEKNFKAKVAAINAVLDLKQIPSGTADNIRSTWAYYLELCIEPAGWQAQWKIPRMLCTELKLDYPVVVLGIVENCIFDELKCSFRVTGVEDENIHLPEICQVNIAELWLTKDQINNVLDFKKTSDCIDQFRFFYNHIWMPWDAEDDEGYRQWADKNLVCRMKFTFDLVSHQISRPLSSYIRSLLDEAKNLKNRKDFLENIIDDDDIDEVKTDDSKKTIKELMNIHFRINAIKDIVEVLMNPKMRLVFEEDFSILQEDTKIANVFVVFKQGEIDEHIKHLELVKSIIGETPIKYMCSSLQEALEKSHYPDKIYIPSGVHEIKFLESFNKGGMIKHLSFKDTETRAVIKARAGDGFLFRMDGNFTLENVSLDCSNVSSGIVIPRGYVNLFKCNIIDSSSLETKQGIVLYDGAKLNIQDTIIDHFDIGISMKSGSELIISEGSCIENCITGIEAEDGCKINLKKGKITNSKLCGILYNTNKDAAVQNKVKQIYENVKDIQNIADIQFDDAFKFENNNKANIVIRNMKYGGNEILIEPEKMIEDDDPVIVYSREEDEFLGFVDGDESVILID